MTHQVNVFPAQTNELALGWNLVISTPEEDQVLSESFAGCKRSKLHVHFQLPVPTAPHSMQIPNYLQGTKTFHGALHSE